MNSRTPLFSGYCISRTSERVSFAHRWLALMACGIALMPGAAARAQENAAAANRANSQDSKKAQESQSKPLPATKHEQKPLHGGSITVSGSLRARTENWGWFDAPPGESDYTFGAAALRVSVSQKREKFDWFVEGMSPWLIGLPTQAVLPAPKGQLGMGASYFAANNHQDGSAVFRQGYLRLRGLFGDKLSSVRVGRFEFSDGAEVKPSDATLATLKSDRIPQRLIGPFGFTHIGRAFDGIHFDRTSKLNNITILGARPVEGVFQLRSLDELDVDFYYGAWTRQLPSHRAPAEARVFVLHYHDGRPVLKTDNRPQPVRAADHKNIRITTFGGHYIAALGSGAAKTDFLFWGAAQVGSWGVQDHRAGAIGIEAGHKVDAAWQPWLRVGYFRSSGDGNPSDNKHNTFFQALPTPRPYARLPFFNMMNNQDVFGELILNPAAKFSLRTDVHWLRLSNSKDLWYLGGGAYQSGTFGYTVRPSNGHSDLGTLFDGSLDYHLTSRTTVTLYGGFVRGGSVEAAIYPQSGSHPPLRLVYLEFLQRF